ncbi:MAG: hypothetical protein J5I90_00225 [Caldilineales bacterium]|nr:hypothetical protein [Caldilineales bacterium]
MPRSPLLLIGLIVIAFICVALFMMRGGDDTPIPASAPQPTELPAAAIAPIEELPTATPRPFTPPPPATGDGDTWLVMLYQDADDKILEQDIYVDMNEAERIGSTDRVHIVTQLDRFRAGYRGDGDWDSTRRYYVTQDDDLNKVRSQQIADLGEANMADADTLVDFVTWAVETFPSDKYALILSDHGLGWPGGWSDPTASGGSDRSIPLTSALGDQLYLHELDDALTEIRNRTGVDKLDLIGLDACLMGHVEVFDALAPHARFAVASQETEPALGWAYTGFLQALAANPDMDGGELSRAIVDSYIQDDQRIVDDQARAEFAGRGGGFAPSAGQLTQQLSQSITLTAIDLSKMPELIGSLNHFASTMQDIDQRAVAQARGYARSFTNIFGRNLPNPYIDLGNFAQIVAQQSRDGAIRQAAEQLLASVNDAVIAEKHGPQKKGATGVSIYFPNSQLYQAPAAGPQSYTAISRRFASESLWDDFLAYHYTGRRFEPSANAIAVPDRGDAVSPPGEGNITVSPLRLSSDTAAPGQPVLLSADVSGENVGHIKLLVGFLDEAANSIYQADTDFLEAGETREVDGVFYPDWGEGDFTVEFEWEPIVFAVSDGNTDAVALFTPQDYGATAEEAVYTVDGFYTYADDGEQRNARLYFANGVLQSVFGFTGEGGAGAPREIVPQPGDTFTVIETWLDLDANGKVVGKASEAGKTLTFGEQPFEWVDLDAAAGRYIVGFIVEDVDGNQQAVYDYVTVE